MRKTWKDNIWVFLSFWFFASILGVFFTYDHFVSERVTMTFLSGIISLSILGIAQWTVLRMYRKNIGLWVIATITGLLLAEVAGDIPLFDGIHLYTWFPYSIETIKNNSLVYLIQGSIRGLLLSLPQWFVLRRHTANAGLWIFATTIGWSIHWVLSQMSYVWFNLIHRNLGIEYTWDNLGQQFLNLGIPYILVTGPIMFWLLWTANERERWEIETKKT